jgi:hypothetical protein
MIAAPCAAPRPPPRPVVSRRRARPSRPLQVAVARLRRLPVLEGFPVHAVPRSPYPNDRWVGQLPLWLPTQSQNFRE